MRDGKNNFYRNLNLDKESKEILKWMRQNKRAILAELDEKNKEKENE
jgi:hypothetical protein